MRPHAHQYLGTKSGCVCQGVGLHDALGDDATITDGQIVLPRPGADLGAGRLDRWRGWGVDVHGWPRPVGATFPRGLRGRSDDWDTRCLLVLVHRSPLGQFIVRREAGRSVARRPADPSAPLRSPRRPATSIILSTDSPALLSPFTRSTDPPIPGSPRTASHLAPRSPEGTDNRDGPPPCPPRNALSGQPNQTAERSSCLVTRRRGPATVDRGPPAATTLTRHTHEDPPASPMWGTRGRAVRGLSGVPRCARPRTSDYL